MSCISIIIAHLGYGCMKCRKILKPESNYRGERCSRVLCSRGFISVTSSCRARSRVNLTRVQGDLMIGHTRQSGPSTATLCLWTLFQNICAASKTSAHALTTHRRENYPTISGASPYTYLPPFLRGAVILDGSMRKSHYLKGGCDV